MTTQIKRVRVAPGIYKRGDVFDIQVTFKDRAGVRRQSWETVKGGLREAKARQTLLKAQAIEGNLVARPDGKALTVERFLTDYYLPYLWEERVIKNRTLGKTTFKIYRRYTYKKIIPALGSMRIADVHSGHIERMLNGLVAGGRDPGDGKGRPAMYPKEVYELIIRTRDQGWPSSDIATLVNARYGSQGIRLTRHSVASICRRHSNPSAAPDRAAGLSVETVDKVYWMLSGAWSYGVKNELIPRDRAHVVAEADRPTEGRWAIRPVKTVWLPDHYARFFDWAVHKRPESWVAFYFVATSGDRISGNLGLRWNAVDLGQCVAQLGLFVKYYGEQDQRVLIEEVGKSGRGHDIILDPRTVAILRDWKARQAAVLHARSDGHTCPTEERDCPLPGYHDRGLVFRRPMATTGTRTSSGTCFKTPSAPTTARTPMSRSR